MRRYETTAAFSLRREAWTEGGIGIGVKEGSGITDREGMEGREALD